MVSKVDRLSTVVLFKKKSQLLQLVDCRLFVDLAVDFLIGFQWENGRIRTKWPQNLQKIPSKSTVDFVADPRSCNSLRFFESRQFVKDPATVDLSSKVDCRLQCLSSHVQWQQVATGVSW